MGRLLGVKAEPASLVTFASKVIVHGNAIDALSGRTQVVKLEIEPEDKSE
jgi:hypothetical protein